MTQDNYSPQYWFYDVIREYNESEDTSNFIEICTVLHSENVDHCEMQDAAGYLISALETSPENWLDFHVLRDDTGEFTAEILTTCGGPTVSLQYDTRNDALWFEYSSAGTRIEALISTEDYTLGGDFASLIQDYAAM